MKRLRKLKETEDAFQRSLAAMNREISKQRKKLLSLEEISWDLQDKLSKLQREIILQFKGLSRDEVLAIRSGLTLEQIKLGKALMADEQKNKADTQAS